MNEMKGLTRRQLLVGGAVAVLGVTTPLPRSLSKLLRHINISEGVARAQDSVKKLQTFPLSKVVELDKKMGAHARTFEEDVNAYWTQVGSGGLKGNYMKVAAWTNSDNMSKKLSVIYLKDPKKIGKDGTVDTTPQNQIAANFDLQPLFDFHQEACGCDPGDKAWIKVMLNVHDDGVDVIATFVDKKPSNSDSSDLKVGRPIFTCVFNRAKNAVYRTDPEHLRIENK